MATAKIAPNVVRGAEFLDDVYGPEWDEQINLRRLDLSKTCDCVVGQLMRHERGSRHLRYQRGLEVLGVDNPHRFGFMVAARQSFDRLTDSWRTLIEQRRKERRT